MEINYLEGNGPEWLMHKGLLLVLIESRILGERERENQSINACLDMVKRAGWVGSGQSGLQVKRVTGQIAHF